MRPPHGVAATMTGLAKTFTRGGTAVHAVVDADLVLRRGEIVALVGASGSGKSTLLTLLIGWEHPDRGEVVVHDLRTGPTDAPRGLGWDVVAVMPQALGLIDDLSMRDNVLLPARARGRLAEYTARADDLTARLGVGHLADRMPGEMSLGEQQRVCLARTLLLSPQLVVADEPTAHQDRGFVDVVIEVLGDEARRGASILLATHNPELTAAADRVLRMSDGRLSTDT